MTFDQRRRWIIAYLKTHKRADILDRYFVDGYVAASNAKVRVMPYGADKCTSLSNDLLRMFREGSLSRNTTGIEGMAGMGFPTWVYVYKLANHLEEA